MPEHARGSSVFGKALLDIVRRDHQDSGSRLSLRTADFGVSAPDIRISALSYKPKSVRPTQSHFPFVHHGVIPRHTSLSLKKAGNISLVHIVECHKRGLHHEETCAHRRHVRRRFPRGRSCSNISACAGHCAWSHDATYHSGPTWHGGPARRCGPAWGRGPSQSSGDEQRGLSTDGSGRSYG